MTMGQTDALVPVNDILYLLGSIVYDEESTAIKLLSLIELDFTKISKPIDNLKALNYFVLHKAYIKSHSDIFEPVLKSCVKWFQYVTDKDVMHVSLLGSILQACLQCIPTDYAHTSLLVLLDFINLNIQNSYLEENNTGLSHSLVILERLCNFIILGNTKISKFQFPKTLISQIIKLVSEMPLEVSRCALTTSLPKLISIQSNNNMLKLIWDEIQIIDPRKDQIEKQLFYICLLSDYFIVSTESTSAYPLFEFPSFWEIIQNGLVDENNLNRKQSLYLLKRYVSVFQDSNITFESKLFCWYKEQKGKLSEFWDNLFVIYETLEEKQVHIIMPAIKNMPQIYLLCEINKSTLYSWLFCAFVRILYHSSNLLIKWGLQELCNLDSQLLFSDRKYKVILTQFFKSLNNMFLYSRHSCPISDSDLERSLEKWFISISLLDMNTYFEIVLQHLADSSWSPIPLFFVVDSLSKVHTQLLWSTKCFNSVQKVLIKTLKTQSIFIRSAIQCRLLKCITRGNPSDLELTLITNILSHFNGEESLHRGSGMWLNCVAWIQNISDPKFCSKLLSLCEHRIFRADAPQISIRSLARTVVLFSDANILQPNDRINNLLKPIFEQFVDCEKRIYSCTTTQDKCTEFLKCLLDEYSSDFTSESEFVTYLSVNIPYLLSYIELKLRRGPLNNVESLHLYESTLVSVARHSYLFKNLQSAFFLLLELSFNVLKSENITFFQEFLALKSIFIYYNNVSIYKTGINQLFGPFEEDVVNYIFRKRLFNKTLIRTFISPTSEQNLKGRLMSEIMQTLWSILNLYFDDNIESTNSILALFPVNTLIDSAQNAVSEDGKEAVAPILKSFIMLLPYSDNLESNIHFIKISWQACFELRKSELFWPAITEWIAMVYQEKITTRREYHNLIFYYSKEIINLGSELIGLVNIFLDHIRKCYITVEFASIITDGLIFGSIARKDRRMEYEVCQYIIKQVEEGTIESFGIWKLLRNDKEVRLKALELLLCSGNNDTITTVINSLLEHYLWITRNKKSHFNDSLGHRSKHKILQALLILEYYIFTNPCTEFDGISDKLFDWVFECLLGTNQQPSVRYQLEWLFIRLILHYPNKLNNFWELFEQAGNERLGSMCSFISIAFHLANIVSNNIFLENCFQNIIPWCMSQNFNVRLYAQVVLSKLWDLNSDISGRYNYIKENQWKINEQGNVIVNAKKMQSDFYFSIFHPIHHFTLKTVYWDLPRLSNISSEEWIHPKILKKYSYLCKHNNGNVEVVSLDSCTSPTWVSRVSGDVDGESDGSSIQKKFIPWKGMFTNPEEGLQETKSGLILVASLIDKAANLGGLARTCEIFAAKEFVIPNLEIIKDKEFMGLSMTAEKHLHITEVKSYNLHEYLKLMKSMGYLLIGAEQTTGSVSLPTYKFGHNCVLLLGNEREGIPANLIPLLDYCVEIPQFGVIRSLNVHVSGALFLWEYSKQHLLQDT